MDRFPVLNGQGIQSRLPLCDNTALSIGQILVERSGEPAAATAAIRTDPVFALWCLCAGHYQRQPPSVEDLGVWFSTIGCREFAAASVAAASVAAGGPVAGAVDLKKILSSVRDLAARAGAAHCAIARPGLAADRGLVLGLLDAARPLLALSADGDANSASVNSLLPAWYLPASNGNQSTKSNEAGQAVDRVAGDTDSPEAVLGIEQMLQQFQQRIPVAPGLLAAICRAYQRILTLDEAFDDAVEREKLASLKQLAYGASHEINNPLANISTRAQTLMRGEQDPERRRQLASINSQAFRAHEMIADMMLFAHPPQLQTSSIDMERLVVQIVEESSNDAIQQDTQLTVSCENGLPQLAGDRVQLSVAVKAMIRNSIEALGAGGHVRVSVGVATDARLEGMSTVEICVSDNGPGISPEIRRHLFDPFYSGREAGRGLGFGLAKCWRIVELHGGSILVDSPAAGGASLTLRLPVAPMDRTSGSASSAISSS